MRNPAVEQIGVPGAKNPPLLPHRHLHPPADDNTPLFAFMAQQDLATVGAGGVAFMQDLQGPTGHVGADLPVADLAAPDLDQFSRREEHPLRPLLRHFQRKELGQPHRNAIQHPLQRSHGRIGAVGFNQRNGGVGHPGPARQFPLAEVLPFTHHPQAGPHTGIHRCVLFCIQPFQAFTILNIMQCILMFFNAITT